MNESVCCSAGTCETAQVEMRNTALEPCLDMSLDINTMMKKPFIKILFDQVVPPSTQWRLFSLPLLLCVWSQRVFN